jgi:hypothetical protein
MTVKEFQLVESSSRIAGWSSMGLCHSTNILCQGIMLIESKTPTWAVLSEWASNDSSSVSWMVLRWSLAFHCGDQCKVANTAFLWKSIVSIKCVIICQMVLLIQINHQQVLCDITIFNLKWIFFEELHIHDMSSDGSSPQCDLNFHECNYVINV